MPPLLSWRLVIKPLERQKVLVDAQMDKTFLVERNRDARDLLTANIDGHNKRSLYLPFHGATAGIVARAGGPDQA